MVLRVDRQYPDIYFGRPGALVKMPYPRGDMDRGYDRLVYDFPTGSGQHMVSSLVGGSRLYSLAWAALHMDNFRMIEQYWTGAMGVGPWVVIDPAAGNLLLPNVASATSTWNDTRSWATSTGAANMGQLSSNQTATFIHRTGAPRSLRWMFSVAAATTPILGMASPYRGWFGIPVVPGLSYALSAWARPDNIVDSSITLAIKFRWMDATGVQIGTDVSGGDIVMTGWTRLSVVGVAPVGAVYLQPIFVATGSTITTGASIYIDETLLEQDTVVNDWAPGTGVRPVEILGLPEVVPFAARFRKGLTMTLRELSA
jgi:hypothetical protein